ncbi:hypothetical protein GJ744_006628 [Endocarpon pusillum]|uniref:Uncharacterized protein n=1 Tax=Endocarpon pusillum TaxID=364733 RepID=A0A8H7E870_9EURO|nr:hypothetical protein GJ744_006628 [Endocarpon pusillum]
MSRSKRSRNERQAQQLPLEDTMQNERNPTRPATVYDAVAGRVGSNGFIDESTRPIRTRNGFPSTESAFAPLEVLLRRATAPTEGRADVYFADENLKPEQKLPDSELLKASHLYASDFYGINSEDGGKRDFKSLDETALIALGILLEEAAVQLLGKTGDMVLVEPEGFDSFIPESRATQMQISGRVPRIETPPYVSEESSDESYDDGMRQRKRMRARDNEMM